MAWLSFGSSVSLLSNFVCLYETHILLGDERLVSPGDQARGAVIRGEADLSDAAAGLHHEEVVVLVQHYASRPGEAPEDETCAVSRGHDGSRVVGLQVHGAALGRYAPRLEEESHPQRGDMREPAHRESLKAKYLATP